MTDTTLLQSQTIADDTQVPLLQVLLRQQSELSAVEQFAAWHDAAPLTSPAADRPGTGGGDGSQQASHYRDLLPAAQPQDGFQYAFAVDLDLCSGCKACVVACHNLNGLQEDETWRRVGLMVDPKGRLPIVQYVTTACHHCEDPGCMNGCPVLAYEKDPTTGIVSHLDDQCFGCQYCTMMCPYEVPQYRPSLGIVRKCDMCTQRLREGEAPACVQACPNRAIEIAIVPKSQAKRLDTFGAGTGTLPTAPPPHWTKPTTQYRSRWQRHPAATAVDESIDRPHHAHIPLVAMLVLSQAACGMFVTVAAVAALNPGLLTARSGLAASAVVAAAIGIIGVHLAMLHLGRPKLFYRAALGWRRSWLSREAIAFGGVMAAWTAAAVCYATQLSPIEPLLDYLPAALSQWLEFLGRTAIPAAAAAAAGGLGVACSAMIYVATRRQLWDQPRTFSLFAGTTGSLGAGSVACCVAAGCWLNGFMIEGSPVPLVGTLLVAAVTLSAASLWPLWQPLQLSSLAKSPAASPTSVTAFAYRQGRLLRRYFARPVRLVFGCHVAAAVVAAAAVATPTELGAQAAFATIGCVGLFIAHLVARSLYFAAVVTHRMPGGGI